MQKSGILQFYKGFGESYVMTIGDGVEVINFSLDHLRCMGVVHKLCQENMKIK